MTLSQLVPAPCQNSVWQRLGTVPSTAFRSAHLHRSNIRDTARSFRKFGKMTPLDNAMKSKVSVFPTSYPLTPGCMANVDRVESIPRYVCQHLCSRSQPEACDIRPSNWKLQRLVVWLQPSECTASGAVICFQPGRTQRANPKSGLAKR